MNREGAIKWAKEIKAFQDGKVIQVELSCGWTDTEEPMFDGGRVYRIKPENKIDVATDKVTACVFTNACISTPLIDEFKEHIREALKDVYGDE